MIAGATSRSCCCFFNGSGDSDAVVCSCVRLCVLACIKNAFVVIWQDRRGPETGKEGGRERCPAAPAHRKRAHAVAQRALVRRQQGVQGKRVVRRRRERRHRGGLRERARRARHGCAGAGERRRRQRGAQRELPVRRLGLAVLAWGVFERGKRVSGVRRHLRHVPRQEGHHCLCLWKAVIDDIDAQRPPLRRADRAARAGTAQEVQHAPRRLPSARAAAHPDAS